MRDLQSIASAFADMSEEDASGKSNSSADAAESSYAMPHRDSPCRSLTPSATSAAFACMGKSKRSHQGLGTQ